MGGVGVRKNPEGIKGYFLEKHIVKPNQISSVLKNEIVVK